MSAAETGAGAATGERSSTPHASGSDILLSASTPPGLLRTEAVWSRCFERQTDASRSSASRDLSEWLDGLKRLEHPRKADQDRLDACLCLVTALHLAGQGICLMVGDMTGYVVVPHGDLLNRELTHRCVAIGFDPAEWVHDFRLSIRPAHVSVSG